MKSKLRSGFAGALGSVLSLGLVSVLANACGGSDNGSTIDDPAAAGGTTNVGGSGGSAAGIGIGGSVGPGAGGSSTNNCGQTKLGAAPPRVNVMLVVDKSESMLDIPAGQSGTKWDAMKPALNAAVAATKANIHYGLQFFPNKSSAGGDACEMPSDSNATVEVATGDAVATAISDAMNATAPGGSTPTAAALKRAHDYFITGAGKDLEGTKYVLLATDGGPNCDATESCSASTCTVNMDNHCPLKDGKRDCSLCPSGNCCGFPDGKISCLDEDGTVARVTELAKDGVKTLVVGIPGTEAYKTTLDKVAVAGALPNPQGPPSYYAVSAQGGVGELTEVLTRITKGLIVTCRLELDAPPVDPNKVNVVVDGQFVKQGDPNGWDWEGSTNTVVLLKGSTCDRVNKEGAQSIDITFGCPTVSVK